MRSGERGAGSAARRGACFPLPSLLPPHPSRQYGFTLIEAIVVIAITGIIAAVVAVFIRSPVQGYLDSARRAELSDEADTALRRIGRDVRLALPNSVRVDGTGQAIEFLQTRSGGRYRAEPNTSGIGAPGDILDFTSGADAAFDVLGAAVEAGAGDQIVVYNLGIPGADAYAGNNRRAFAGVPGLVSNVAFTATGAPFPFASPGNRFHVVETPVTYLCDMAAGTLRRHWGYAISAAQSVPPAGGSSALIASHVSGCTFTYDPNVVAKRAGLVTLHLTLTLGGEAVTLYQAAHVSNVP